MMLDFIAFHEPGSKLSRDQLAAFEVAIGGRLPEDYKQFLLERNGGMVEPELGLRWRGRVNVIPCINSIEPDLDCFPWRALQRLRGFGIDGFLPFSSLRNGEDICLDFLNEIGTVWIADFAYEDDQPVSATMEPLASSFTEFVKQLVVIPEIYCPIADLGEHGSPTDLDAYLAEGASIDSIGKNGLTVLCEAIKFNNMPTLNACLERGASLAKSIYIAVVNRRPDLIKLLVERDADVNERNEYGHRPLYYLGGTLLPGRDGEINREVEQTLIGLGATL